MKTIGTILYGLVMLAAVVVTVAITAVLVFGPVDVMAYDEGYPVDAGYPINDPEPYVYTCDELQWMGYWSEICDAPEPVRPEPEPFTGLTDDLEFVAGEPGRPEKEPAEGTTDDLEYVLPEPETITSVIIQPVVIRPITARLMSGYNLFVW